jgi:excisionase family DNA binding protein
MVAGGFCAEKPWAGIAAHRQEKTMKATAGDSVSAKVMEWVQQNDWYQISTDTNRLRLEQHFGQAIETIAHQLDYYDKPKLRRQLLDCWDSLTAKCMKIDLLCRAGCSSLKERLELDFLRCKAIGAGCELAELLNLITGSPASENQGSGLLSPVCQPVSPVISESTTEWITYGQAAEILLVSKATVCRWVKEGKLVGNGKQGRQIRLRKTSVLLAKQDMEEQQLRQDVQDLRKDARKTNF